MTPEEIRNDIEGGACFWHWPTGLLVFYDRDFDTDETFGITMLDRGDMRESVWDGYHPHNDDSISRDTASRIIATTEDWHHTGEDDLTYIGMTEGLEYGRDVYAALRELRQSE